MLVRIVFSLAVMILGGMILADSVLGDIQYIGVAISAVLILGGLALIHPVSLRHVENWVERIEEKILPKSASATTGLALAIIFWGFAWTKFTSDTEKAPTGASRFLLAPIYNVAGNDGIAVVSLVLGAFFLWLGYRTKK